LKIDFLARGWMGRGHTVAGAVCTDGTLHEGMLIDGGGGGQGGEERGCEDGGLHGESWGLGVV
jgi:hypothetical protein